MECFKNRSNEIRTNEISIRREPLYDIKRNLSGNALMFDAPWQNEPDHPDPNCRYENAGNKSIEFTKGIYL